MNVDNMPSVLTENWADDDNDNALWLLGGAAWRKGSIYRPGWACMWTYKKYKRHESARSHHTL